MMSLFSATFIIPLLMLLASASVDIQAYTTQSSELQETCDDAALVGTQYLPDLKKAQSAVDGLFKARNSDAVAVVVIKNNSLNVEARKTFTPFLASFFKNNAGDDTAFTLPLIATSSGRANPVDLFVGIERGSRVAPSLTATHDQRWGTESTYPTASYFVSHPINGIDPSIATEQCFNPQYSLIKQAAIRVLDSVSALSVNQTGVYFFPGSWSLAGRNRELSLVTDPTASSPTAYSFFDTNINSDGQSNYTDSEFEPTSISNQNPSPFSWVFPVQSMHCALLAEGIQGASSNYQFPIRPSYQTATSQALVEESSITLNQSYPLSYRESIWSRVANTQGYFDTAIALQYMEQALLHTTAATIRGGMVNRAHQVAVIVTNGPPQYLGSTLAEQGDTAWTGITSTLLKLKADKQGDQNSLTIFYVMLNATAQQVMITQSLFDQAEISDAQQKPLLQTKCFSGQNFDALINQALPALLRGQQESVISK